MDDSCTHCTPSTRDTSLDSSDRQSILDEPFLNEFLNPKTGDYELVC